jgi:hypothetical protein
MFQRRATHAHLTIVVISEREVIAVGSLSTGMVAIFNFKSLMNTSLGESEQSVCMVVWAFLSRHNKVIVNADLRRIGDVLPGLIAWLTFGKRKRWSRHRHCRFFRLFWF